MLNVTLGSFAALVSRLPQLAFGKTDLNSDPVTTVKHEYGDPVEFNVS